MIEKNDFSIDLDVKGTFKYNQKRGIISPSYACFANSLCEGYEIYKQSEDCWDNVKNYHIEYKRIADKFMYFCRFEPCVTEMYKFYNPREYNTWINDETKDKWLYSDNSIPPNEIFKIITIAFNMFLSINDVDNYKNTVYIDNINKDEIIKNLNEEKPIVASFNLNGFGHIMCIKGYNEEGFIVYDTYACNYMRKFKTIKSAKLIPYENFNNICKSINNPIKKCVCFE